MPEQLYVQHAQSQDERQADMKDKEFDGVKMMSRVAQKEHPADLSQLTSRLSAVKKFDASVGEGPFSSVKEVITDSI